MNQVCSLSDLVRFVQVLTDADQVGGLRLYQHSWQAAKRAPTPHNQIRLALALSNPRHGFYDVPGALALLDELRVDLQLPPDDRRFVELIRNDLLERHRLDLLGESTQGELETLKQQALALSRDKSRANDEIRELTAALAEARAKLTALTNIEKSIDNSTQSSSELP